MAINIPARPAGFGIFFGTPLGINGHHNALRTIFVRGIFNHLRISQRCGVKADFVCPGIQQALHVLDCTHAPAHRQGNEYLRGHCFNDGQDQVTAIAGSRDVQKCQLVSALVVVACSNFYRIACITQLSEINTFNHAPTGHVKAGNDALGKHKSAVWLSR